MGTMTIVPEELFRGNGYSPAVALGELQGKSIQLTLSITRMMEEQTLEVLIWGSADGSQWMDRPLVTLPHRHYCGDYTYTVELSRHPVTLYVLLMELTSTPRSRMPGMARIGVWDVPSYRMCS